MEQATALQKEQSNNEGSVIKKYIELISKCRGEKHLIVIQNYPDPDAISSGLAQKMIAAHYGVESDIIFAGQVSHSENIALVKLLDIQMRKWHPGFDISEYDGAVFVDNQGTTAGPITEAIKAANIKELIVIDHHELQEMIGPEYSDIRKVGATATIFADYLNNEVIPFETSKKENSLLATALMHGIRTDTAGFVFAGPADFTAAAFLSRYIDRDLLAEITSQARSKQTMEIIQQAISNRSIIESFSIAGIGYVRCEHRDVIPQAADILLSEENVHTAIVFGVISSTESEKEVLIGSMRTSKLTVDPDEFIKEVFGKDSNGRYFGGGKKTAGGFEIPVGFLSGGNDKEYRDMKWKVYKTQIMQKLAYKIGIHEEHPLIDDKNGS